MGAFEKGDFKISLLQVDGGVIFPLGQFLYQAEQRFMAGGISGLDRPCRQGRIDMFLREENPGQDLIVGDVRPSDFFAQLGDGWLGLLPIYEIPGLLEAERGGADFITLGPIYHTPSKMKYGEPIGIETLRNIKAKISIPVFAIGGIKSDKVREVKEAGADGLALISAILTAEHIKGTTEAFLRLLK